MKTLINNTEENKNSLLLIPDDNSKYEIQDTDTNLSEEDEAEDIYDGYDAYDAEEDKVGDIYDTNDAQED